MMLRQFPKSNISIHVLREEDDVLRIFKCL